MPPLSQNPVYWDVCGALRRLEARQSCLAVRMKIVVAARDELRRVLRECTSR